MKKIIGLIIALGIYGAFATPVLIWDSYMKKQPPISMPAAYLAATQLLGSATNDFFCVGTKLTTQGGRPNQTEAGEWGFIFCNTNGHRKIIYVFMGEHKTPQATEAGYFSQD